MRDRTLYDLGDQHLAILEAIWRHDGATVRQIWETLSPDRSIAYTSILSVMQKLERTGWLNHKRQGRRYVYRVTCTREQAARRAVEKFVARIGDRSILREASPRPRLRLRDLVDSRGASS